MYSIVINSLLDRIQKMLKEPNHAFLAHLA